MRHRWELLRERLVRRQESRQLVVDPTTDQDPLLKVRYSQFKAMIHALVETGMYDLLQRLVSDSVEGCRTALEESTPDDVRVLQRELQTIRTFGEVLEILKNVADGKEQLERAEVLRIYIIPEESYDEAAD